MRGAEGTELHRDIEQRLTIRADEQRTERAGLVSRRAVLGGFLALVWEAHALAQTSPGGSGQTLSASDALAAAGPPTAPDWPKVIKSGDAAATFYLPQL